MEYLAEFLVLFLAITITTSISTVHHDKPESVTLSTLKTTAHSTESTVLTTNVTLNPTDRKKRLLPYENFYLKQNFNKPLAYIEQSGPSNGGRYSNSGYSSHHQQFKDLIEGRVKKKQHYRGHVDGLRSNGKFTPFLESNAIPGPLRPMIPAPRPVVPVKVEYVSLNPPPPPHEEVEEGKGPPPDFSAIYDTLSQLKLRQHELKKPSYGFRAAQRYQSQARPQNQQEVYVNKDPSVYKTIQPSKTYIETFTATNIDITAPAAQKEYEFSAQQSPRYPIYDQKTQVLKPTFRAHARKPYIDQQVAVEVPKSGFLVEYAQGQTQRNLLHSKERPRNNRPYFFYQRKPEEEKSQAILVRKPKPVAVIEENNFVAEKYVPLLPLKLSPHAYTSQEQHYETSPASYYQEEYVYKPRYPPTSNYRIKGTQKQPQSYQSIVQKPQRYLTGSNSQQPEIYNVRGSYEAVTPHPQYEVVTSKPSQKYQQGQKYMVVEINPESHSYKLVSPKPQIIEIVTKEPASKYPVQHYSYQSVTPASISSTGRPKDQEQHEITEGHTYLKNILLSTRQPEVQEPLEIDEIHRYPTSETKQDQKDAKLVQNEHEQYEPVRTVPYKYQNFEVPKYQVVEEPMYEQVEVPKYQEIEEQEPNPGLAIILKQLQETNTLPQTLTPDNIDNSIKTLVRILDALKTRQKQNKPSLYHEDYQDDLDNEAGVDLGGPDSELDTPDGGTPGKPGVDYPALSHIPPTSFSCKTQRYKGFFGDPDTNCQVWHYCDLNGGQASFLCPNGTIFSQVALTCDWWFNVKCASTAQLYVLNERLYKYIIPLAPKFPEDYSGPLVDKYLAIKFQEMEEKLKKQKKGKGNKDSEEEKNESDEHEGKEKNDKEGESEDEEETTSEARASSKDEQHTTEHEEETEK